MASLHQRLKALVLTYTPPIALNWLKKRHYVRALRSFDEPDAKVVRAVVRPGDWTLDIGANAGWYTALLSKLVGPRGRVTSIEPIPPTFDILSHCVKALDLSNVELMSYAISNKKDVVRMELPSFESGGENFYQARIVAADPALAGDGGFQVESRTLDQLFADADMPIQFIKCDVEGHELAVLEGATRLIERDHPAWMLEVSGDPDRAGSRAQRVVDQLSSWGYAVFWFDGTELRQRAIGDVAVNYFFLTSGQLEALIGRGVSIRRAGG